MSVWVPAEGPPFPLLFVLFFLRSEPKAPAGEAVMFPLPSGRVMGCSPYTPAPGEARCQGRPCAGLGRALLSLQGPAHLSYLLVT